eukprot:3057106-Rhodomonas_salina.2
MSGTNEAMLLPGQARYRHPQHQLCASLRGTVPLTVLRIRYEMSGTDLNAPLIVLRCRYEISGTDIGATLFSYAVTTECPVLT